MKPGNQYRASTTTTMSLGLLAALISLIGLFKVEWPHLPEKTLPDLQHPSRFLSNHAGRDCCKRIGQALKNMMGDKRKRVVAPNEEIIQADGDPRNDSDVNLEDIVLRPIQRAPSASLDLMLRIEFMMIQVKSIINIPDMPLNIQNIVEGLFKPNMNWVKGAIKNYNNGVYTRVIEMTGVSLKYEMVKRWLAYTGFTDIWSRSPWIATSLIRSDCGVEMFGAADFPDRIGLMYSKERVAFVLGSGSDMDSGYLSDHAEIARCLLEGMYGLSCLRRTFATWSKKGFPAAQHLLLSSANEGSKNRVIHDGKEWYDKVHFTLDDFLPDICLKRRKINSSSAVNRWWSWNEVLIWPKDAWEAGLKKAVIGVYIHPELCLDLLGAKFPTTETSMPEDEAKKLQQVLEFVLLFHEHLKAGLPIMTSSDDRMSMVPCLYDESDDDGQ